VRPKSYESLLSPLWPHLFDWFDAEQTGAPVEVRHPYLDLRLLRFMLAVPAVPWCRHKYLVRRAMRGELPTPVLRRTKKSLPPRRLWENERRLAAAPFVPTSALFEYVDPHRMGDGGEGEPPMIEALLRIRALNHWLQSVGMKADSVGMEHSHEHRRSAGR
jgi:asparagine synthase (glutamine-hydrolysing)